MLYSQKNKGVAVPECEEEALGNVAGEKCSDLKVATKTSETFNGDYCAEVNGQYDLAEIITSKRIASSLSCIQKY